MNAEQKALIDRLHNPEWIVPGATLDTVKTVADMEAAAKLLENLLMESGG
jgi:hypothetical protein